MNKWIKILIVAVFAMAASQSSMAQNKHRSQKQIIRQGLKIVPDTVGTTPDSLMVGQSDSLFVAGDSLSVSLASDSTRVSVDSLITSSMVDSLDVILASDTTTRRTLRERLLPDSMSISRMSWISLAVPGYGQIYNKQYKKLPVLYGLVGAGVGMYIHENSKYKPLKREYDAVTAITTTRTPALDQLQTEMIQSNTRRQLYMAAAITAYVYFIGDAAINYSTSEVSRVKKATTLSTIIPGAGQIYNGSYWKVPFVIGGFATFAYVIDWNTRGYNRFKTAYALRAAYDSNPELYPNGSPDEFGGRYSASYLQSLRNNYRRNRDLGIILTAGFYIIQIIDAHVDAHLKDFDVSDDLTMNILPYIDHSYDHSVGSNRTSLGFNLSINF